MPDMSVENVSKLRSRDWFVKYRNGKKFIYNQQRGRITHTNPVLKASIAELVTLTMIKNGFDHEAIATVYGCSKSLVDNQVHHMQCVNHTFAGNLFKKVKTLDLDNPMAWIGLAVRFKNLQKRGILFERIERATKALNDDALLRTGECPFGTFPPEELDLAKEKSWRSTLKRKEEEKLKNQTS